MKTTSPFTKLICILVTACFLMASLADAGSATWNLNPADDDWINPNNWTPATVPNGPSDTATFGVSNMSIISLTISTELAEIIFQPGASAYVIGTAPNGAVLTMSGTGVTNNSGISQIIATLPTFVGPGGIIFTKSASAGSQMTYTNNGVSFGDPPEIDFLNSSSAGSGTFTNSGSFAAGVGGSLVVFADSSTASQATLINNGSTTAGGGGGVTRFIGTSRAASATLIANSGQGGGAGGLIEFGNTSDGGTARVEVFGNGSLDISLHNALVVTTGSIEGTGNVFLGGNGSINGVKNLTVGSNSLSTTFSGKIQDGGIGGGTGGSLTKTGKGRLTLSKASTYTGGTTVRKGTLLVTNRTGSATGTGGVRIKAGTLGGTGTISGAVTVASGVAAAILAPGSGSKPGTLTMLRTLAFNSRATYKVDLNSTLVTADQVAANGVTINSGATVTIGDLGGGTLTAGTVFTLINNTAATPIAGTFSNLADGSIFTVGSNTFQANYEGGDGNDLTLTVQ